jgi:hypothetical protein
MKLRLSALRFVLASMLGASSGCGTLSSAQQAKGTGVRRTYDATADQVWNAGLHALSELRIRIASSSRPDGYILAEASMSGWSWGEKIAIFVQEISPSRTEVEVVSKRALATNVTARDWENPVLDKIEDVLRAIPK